MLVSLDLPEELLRYLDSKIIHTDQAPRPPRWPFRRSSVVPDLLDKDGLLLLNLYEEKKRIYAEYLHDPRAPRSRSKVMRVLIEQAIAEGKLK